MATTPGDVAPKLNPAVDITRLQLEPREAFVLSRIDGSTSLSALADLVGMKTTELQPLLVRLARAGAILWGDPIDLEPEEADKDVPPEVARALAESNDLSKADRLRILVAMRDLEESTYWELFGLHGNPTVADVKRAYFDMSKQFHPDRWFGKNTGSFGPVIDKVFRGIKEAYEVLGDDGRRAAYQAEHPPPAKARRSLAELGPAALRRNKPAPGAAEKTTGPTPAELKERNARLEARRHEILEERRKKQQGPAGDTALKAKDLYQTGVEQLKKKELLAAAASFKLAAAYAPHNEEYQQRYKETNELALAERAAELVSQADIEAATGQFANAARAYCRASDSLPNNSQYAMRAAELLVSAGDAAAALEYAQRAVKAAPRRKEARLVAAQLLQDKGDVDGALAHLEIAASLDKQDAHVKKLVKELSKRHKK